MVMGFNGKNNLDIDRLTTMLEENRTLLNDMATKECTDGATLPKLLFELVEQASVKDSVTAGSEDEGARVALSRQVSREVTHIKEGRSTKEGEELQTARMAKIVSDDNASCQSQDEEDGDGEEIDEVDNENMTLASGSQQAAGMEREIQQQQQEIIDDSDAAASSDVAFATNEKVSGITLQHQLQQQQPAKSKKQHHSHNHRKSSNTIKKSTNDNIATLKFTDPSVMAKVASTQEIIGNLPKVWRVLVELLNHHHTDPVQFEENGKGEDCYKSVQTPYGPKAELSVSKTYLKLKVCG